MPPALNAVYNDILFQSPVEAQNSLGELSGAMYASLLSYARNNALLNGQYLIDQLSDTLERPKGSNNCQNPDDPQPSDWNAWLRFFGTTGANANSREMSGLNSASGGLIIGADRWLSDTVTQRGHLRHLQRIASSNEHRPLMNPPTYRHDYNIGVTASQTLNQFYIIGFAGLRQIEAITQPSEPLTSPISTTRLTRRPTAAISATPASRRARPLISGNCRLQPLLGLQYLNISNGSVSENGAGATNLRSPGVVRH